MSVSCVEVKHSIPVSVEWICGVRVDVSTRAGRTNRDTLLFLVAYEDKHGLCAPSMKELGAAFGIGQMGATARIRNLEKAGLAARVWRGDGLSNLIVPLRDGDPKPAYRPGAVIARDDDEDQMNEPGSGTTGLTSDDHP